MLVVYYSFVYYYIILQEEHNPLKRQMRGLDRDKVVKNISKCPLSITETEVLALGLNFVVTPARLPISDFVTGIEAATGRLTPEMAHHLKTEATEYLKKKRTPCAPSNLVKQHREALNKLRRDGSIIILPADKGNATVVMDKIDYRNKMQELLEGGSYKIRKGDLSVKLEKEMNKKLKNCGSKERLIKICMTN